MPLSCLLSLSGVNLVGRVLFAISVFLSLGVCTAAVPSPGSASVRRAGLAASATSVCTAFPLLEQVKQPPLVLQTCKSPSG